MLRTLWNKHPGGIDFPYEKHDAEAIEWINKMAEFTASFRGEIIVYTEKEGGTYSIQHTRPMIEQATRLNQLFFNLACGHAVLRGGAGIEKEDVGVVARVMLASAADPRPLILRTLIERGGAVNVEEVQGILRCSRTRAQREMEKFIALGMCVGDIEYEGEQRQTFGSYGIDGLPDLDGTVKGQKKKFIEIEEKFKWLVSEELKEIIR
jgi:hypothetical protein